MRWQLAYPGQALPVIGKFLPYIFGPGSMPDGKMTPDFYNSLGAMHGTIMIFARRGAVGVRRVWKLRRATANRRAGHDLPESERGKFLGVWRWAV